MPLRLLITRNALQATRHHARTCVTQYVVSDLPGGACSFPSLAEAEQAAAKSGQALASPVFNFRVENRIGGACVAMFNSYTSFQEAYTEFLGLANDSALSLWWGSERIADAAYTADPKRIRTWQSSNVLWMYDRLGPAWAA